MDDQEIFPCQICGEYKRKSDLVPAALIQTSIADAIVKEHPVWSPEGYICHADLNRFRMGYIRDILEKEKEEYSSLEETVRHGGKEEDHLPKNINENSYKPGLDFYLSTPNKRYGRVWGLFSASGIYKNRQFREQVR